MNEYKLGTEVVAHIAQLLQLALMTGTDVAEQFMLMRLSPSDLDPSKLDLSEEYKEDASNNIEKLILRAQELSEEAVDSKDPVLQTENSN